MDKPREVNRIWDQCYVKNGTVKGEIAKKKQVGELGRITKGMTLEAKRDFRNSIQ